MALSQVGMVNLALGRIGAARITSMEDASVEARSASACFDALRDELLVSYPWSFARKRAALNVDSEAPAFGYDHAYLLPSDYLDLIEVENAPPFVIEGGKLLTDADEVTVLYTARITNVALFPPFFTQAFWRYLAVQLAMDVAKSKSLREACLQEYLRASAEAVNGDRRQSQPDETRANPYTQARA